MINLAENQVEVYLRRVERRTRYMEYTKPEDTPQFRSPVRFCYVEAKANEEFTVVIRIYPQFNYFTASGIQVRLWLDNHDEPDVYFHPKIRSFHPNGNEYVMKDFTAKVGDEWHNGQLAFGEPHVDEQTGRETSSVDFMGSVRVSIQRGFQEENEDFAIHERVQGKELGSTVPKSAVRVGNVSHLVRPIKAEVVEQPQYAEQFRGLLGQNGAQYIYEFRYRSRRELRQLGLIDAGGARVTTPALNRLQTPGLFMTPSPRHQAYPRTSPRPLNLPRDTVPVLSSRQIKRKPSPENTMQISGSQPAKRTRTFEQPPLIASPPPRRAGSGGAPNRRPLCGSTLLAPSPAAVSTSEGRSRIFPGNTTRQSPTNATSPTVIDVDELDENELRLRMRRAEIAMRKVELEQAQLRIEEDRIEMEICLAKLRKPRGTTDSQTPDK